MITTLGFFLGKLANVFIEEFLLQRTGSIFWRIDTTHLFAIICVNIRKSLIEKWKIFA